MVAADAGSAVRDDDEDAIRLLAFGQRCVRARLQNNRVIKLTRAGIGIKTLAAILNWNLPYCTRPTTI